MSDKILIPEQEFYCRECKKSFVVKDEEHYYNYKCPECDMISPIKGSLGNIFRGLPTVKK